MNKIVKINCNDSTYAVVCPKGYLRLEPQFRNEAAASKERA